MLLLVGMVPTCEVVIAAWVGNVRGRNSSKARVLHESTKAVRASHQLLLYKMCYSTYII